jgi:outer membrane protein OmpA-like peptidoglycan-associated protein
MKKNIFCFVIAAIALLFCQIGLAKEKPTAQDWLLQGTEFEKKGVYEEAIKMYTEAIDLDENCSAAYFNRAKSRMAHHKTYASEALRDFNKTIDLEPGNAEAYYERGLLNAFMINNENALADMKTAAKLGHQGAQQWLAPAATKEKTEVKEIQPAQAVVEAPQAPVVKKEKATEAPNFPIGEYLASKKEPLILFDFNKSDIKRQYLPVLDEIAVVFKEKLPEASIVLAGHTDSSGTENYNESLSLQRAKAVESYLKEKHGFTAERFIVKGYGKNVPIASNSTKKGQAKNRRVELLGAGKK